MNDVAARQFDLSALSEDQQRELVADLNDEDGEHQKGNRSAPSSNEEF